MYVRTCYINSIWLSRICISKRVGNNSTALWIYDNHSGPDGLRLIENLRDPVTKKISCDIFGPEKNDAIFISLIIFNFILSFLTFFFLREYMQRIMRYLLLRKLSFLDDYQYIVCGSMNSYFIRLISAEFTQPIIEVQHGFIDDTYFLNKPSIFFARSQFGKRFAESRKIESMQIANDLKIPNYIRVKEVNYKCIIVYSKNPGGGCTKESLAEFECAIMDFSFEQKKKLKICLHPRDNILKFFLRHRSFKSLQYLFTKITEPKIVVTSMSSVLTTGTSIDDVVVNLILADPDNQAMLKYYDFISSTTLESFKASGVVNLNRRVE